MPDLLVPLYKLPPRFEGELTSDGAAVVIRRANSFELTRVSDFITANFGQSWADETQVGFMRQPITVYIAVSKGQVIGFATYESTRRGFFGPTGVAPSYRGSGIGRALLIAALWGLADLGYVYAVIGAAGPVEFYQKAVGAVVIPDSTPGSYTDMLQSA